jgi:hypothetical protein
MRTASRTGRSGAGDKLENLARNYHEGYAREGVREKQQDSEHKTADGKHESDRPEEEFYQVYHAFFLTVGIYDGFRDGVTATPSPSSKPLPSREG